MSRRRQAVTLLDKMRRTARMRGGTSLTGVVGTGRTGGPGQLVSFRVTDSLAVLSAAFGIHSVEARHAGFLNVLNQMSLYPNAVDEAKSPGEVQEDVQPFFEDS